MLTDVEYFPLTPDQVRRLGRLVTTELLTVLLEYGVIAGGAAVFVLNSYVPFNAVGDVDVFIQDANRLVECFHAVRRHWPDAVFVRQPSTIKLIVKGETPIQLVRSSAGLEEQIRGFDIDAVQCAIVGGRGESLQACRTEMAKTAHTTRLVKYLLEYSYNPLRLASRLRRIHRKGFSLKRNVETVGQLGVTLYKHHHGNFTIEERQLVVAKYDIDLTSRWPEDPAEYEWASGDYKAALATPFSNFSRTSYDGVASATTVTITTRWVGLAEWLMRLATQITPQWLRVWLPLWAQTPLAAPAPTHRYVQLDDLETGENLPTNVTVYDHRAAGASANL